MNEFNDRAVAVVAGLLNTVTIRTSFGKVAESQAAIYSSEYDRSTRTDMLRDSGLVPKSTYDYMKERGLSVGAVLVRGISYTLQLLYDNGMTEKTPIDEACRRLREMVRKLNSKNVENKYLALTGSHLRKGKPTKNLTAMDMDHIGILCKEWEAYKALIYAANKNLTETEWKNQPAITMVNVAQLDATRNPLWFRVPATVLQQARPCWVFLGVSFDTMGDMRVFSEALESFTAARITARQAILAHVPGVVEQLYARLLSESAECVQIWLYTCLVSELRHVQRLVESLRDKTPAHSDMHNRVKQQTDALMVRVFKQSRRWCRRLETFAVTPLTADLGTVLSGLSRDNRDLLDPMHRLYLAETTTKSTAIEKRWRWSLERRPSQPAESTRLADEAIEFALGLMTPHESEGGLPSPLDPPGDGSPPYLLSIGDMDRQDRKSERDSDDDSTQHSIPSFMYGKLARLASRENRKSHALDEGAEDSDQESGDGDGDGGGGDGSGTGAGADEDDQGSIREHKTPPVQSYSMSQEFESMLERIRQERRGIVIELCDTWAKQWLCESQASWIKAQTRCLDIYRSIHKSVKAGSMVGNAIRMQEDMVERLSPPGIQDSPTRLTLYGSQIDRLMDRYESLVDQCSSLYQHQGFMYLYKMLCDSSDGATYGSSAFVPARLHGQAKSLADDELQAIISAIQRIMCRQMLSDFDKDCDAIRECKLPADIGFFRGSTERYRELELAIAREFKTIRLPTGDDGKPRPEKKRRISLDAKQDPQDVDEQETGDYQILRVSGSSLDFSRPLENFVQSIVTTTMSQVLDHKSQLQHLGKRKRDEQSRSGDTATHPLGNDYNLDVAALMKQTCKLEYKSEAVRLFMTAYFDKLDVVEGVQNKLKQLQWTLPRYMTESSHHAFESEGHESTQSVVDKIAWVGHVVLACAWFETVTGLL